MSNNNSFRLRTLSALGGAVTLAGLFLSTNAEAVGTRHFVIETSSEFSAGELDGAAVDSQGFVRAGLDLGSIEVSGADNVWAALEHEGTVYLATGNDGKLVELKDGKTKVLATVKDAMALTSLVRAFGKTLVGAMPGGKVYELKGDKLVEFTELKEKKETSAHVWSMSYDEANKALYVASGPHGKVFRVTADGTAQVYFDAEQSHIVSVLAHEGSVYAGSSGDARLYKISGPGRAEVLHDFKGTEVRSIVADASGNIVVAVNELKGGPRSDSISNERAKGPASSSSKGGSGEIYRFNKAGESSLLYAEKKDFFISLSLDEKGRPLVGTGKEGRIVRLEKDRRSVVIADVEERQVSALSLDGSTGWVIASDPIVAHPVEGIGGTDALWTSDVLDAGLRARFGRSSWDSTGKVEITTRSGNTKKPDETWSDWSPELRKGAIVSSKPGRYLQIRARLMSRKSKLKRLDVPFVTDNLGATVTSVTAKSGNQAKGSAGMQSSGAPLDGKSSSKVKLSWKVENPDEDALRYRIDYRLEGEKNWFDALAPGKVLKSSSFEWDTKDLPEGKYRVRVEASDELSNPASRVRKHSLSSEQILVDNTAPEFVSLAIRGGNLTGEVRDGVGPIQRLEVRVSGEEQWLPFEPTDGIFDQSSERFSVPLSSLPVEGKALVTVRVFDTGGNKEVRHLRLPAGQ